MTNQRSTVSLILDSNLQEDLSNAAFELRQSQTQLATNAIQFFLEHLQKTRQIKPANRPLPAHR